MNESERLHTAVRDERARRRWAEKELVKETDRVQVWRQRAEDRTARIRLLEERIAGLATQPPGSPGGSLLAAGRRVLRRLIPDTKRAGVELFEDDAVPTDVAFADPIDAIVRRPAYPFIKTAALGGSDLPFLREFDTVDLASDPDALYDADLVFVATANLVNCDAELSAALIEWTAVPARQPLVIWNDAPASAEIGPIIESADLCLVEPDGSAGDCTKFSSGFDPLLGGPSVVTPPDRIDETAGSDVHGQHALAAKRVLYRSDASSERAAELLTMLGIDAPDPTPEIGALLITNKPEFVLGAVELILGQLNVRVFLVVGLHGDTAHFDGIRQQMTESLRRHPSRILEFDTDLTLGECLNRAAASCASPILAKFDDDDWYGPHYLEDALTSLKYSQADLVGKARYFVEIEESGDVYLVDGPEESFANHLIGSSLVFRRSLWEEVPFPHRPSRVDSIFLRGVRAVGAKIYSNSRYEFGVRRRRGEHTWVVDPAHFAARGTRIGSTFADIVVDVDDSLAGDDA